MAEPYLTMAEIEVKYPNEWVLINNPKTTKYQEVLSGYVIYHGPDKVALHQMVDTLPTPFNIAVRYNGPLFDEGEEVCLNLGLLDLESPFPCSPSHGDPVAVVRTSHEVVSLMQVLQRRLRLVLLPVICARRGTRRSADTETPLWVWFVFVFAFAVPDLVALPVVIPVLVGPVIEFPVIEFPAVGWPTIELLVCG